MATYDRMSSLFWIVFGIAITVESLRLGPGSLSGPGPGLLPLGCGLALGILGFTIFLRTFKQESQEREILWEEGTLWRKLILTLASLVCYAFLLDVLGFLLLTFIWMLFVCKVGKLGWKKTVAIAIIVTFCCYGLFNYLLGIRFPRGILG